MSEELKKIKEKEEFEAKIQKYNQIMKDNEHKDIEFRVYVRGIGIRINNYFITESGFMEMYYGKNLITEVDLHDVEDIYVWKLSQLKNVRKK